MRKVVVTKFSTDPSEALSVVTVPITPPAASQVQCQVLYSGFNGADVSISRGVYPMQPPAPLTPGYCFVGRVLSSGPRPSCAPPNSEWAPGTLVTAMTVYDSEAERINVDEKHLVRVPAGVNPIAATALTLDWNTAYGMVEHAAVVRPGQNVFVHGLSGAVGYATMALCQLRGATVFGTASKRNHAALVELGAHPFVYTDKAWIKAIKAQGGVDAVFDPLGFKSYDESYSILATTRPSVLVGYGSNQNTLPSSSSSPTQGAAAKQEPAKDLRKLPSPYPQIAKLLAKNLKRIIGDSRRTVFYYIDRDQKTFRPDLEALLEMCQSGKIKVPIKAVWNLEDVVEAHRGWGKKEGMGSMFIKCSE